MSKNKKYNFKIITKYSAKSFDDIDIWIKDLRQNSSPDVKVFLIGNKADLEDSRLINKETAEKFSKAHGFNFFTETSAKTGFNAQNVFIEAAKELYLAQLEYKDRASRPGSMVPTPYHQEISNNVVLEEEETKPRKKKGCC